MKPKLEIKIRITSAFYGCEKLSNKKLNSIIKKALKRAILEIETDREI